MSKTEDTDYDDVSYVISSQYRSSVVKALENGPATPSKLAKDVECRVTHVSRALNELKEKDIVELLVSEDVKKGRIYHLTDSGREASRAVEEMGA